MASLLVGCSAFPTKFPEESDLYGTWVSVGILPYYLLEYKGSGNAVLVIVGPDELVTTYKLEEFKSNEYGFTVKVSDVAEEEEPEILSGSLLGDQLGLKDPNDEIELWFSKKYKVATAKLFSEKSVVSYNASDKISHDK